MYRRTAKATATRAAQLAAAQRARDLARMERPAPDYLTELPALRMRITVERFDFGLEQHVLELRRSRRVDQYAVLIDGRPWRVCGLSGVLEGLRKAMPRVASARALR